MKKVLLTVVLILAMGIPAFAQNGPIRIKPLMIYTEDGLGQTTAWFSVGQTIFLGTAIERKGTGTYKARVEVRDSLGSLVLSTTAYPVVDTPTYEVVDESIPLGNIQGGGGYFTIKVVYTDRKTGRQWSQQMKIHVLPPT